jgi:hypothetical protein
MNRVSIFPKMDNYGARWADKSNRKVFGSAGTPPAGVFTDLSATSVPDGPGPVIPSSNSHMGLIIIGLIVLAGVALAYAA